MGVGVEWHAYPVDACDFIERHGVRGRVFNSFELGGYLLYRFWPERDRLPFIDVHASGTPEDRLLYVYAEAEAEGWRRLQAKYPLDWVLLLRREVEGQTLHDTIEHDPRWAMVFLDDAAVIYVRRDGALARLAPLEYRELRAGREGLRALGEACGTDSARRERARLEFERAARESHANAASHSFLATIALMDGRPAEAEPHLNAALAVDPLIPRAHERLGDLALGSGRPREAIREYELEKRAQLPPPGIELRIGQAWSRLGDRAAARAAYRRALEDPSADAEARDSLAAMERSGR
jgi:tetratricopeptide (TPR) repeat protein